MSDIPPPLPGYQPQQTYLQPTNPPPAAPRRRGGRIFAILVTLLLLVSIVANGILLVMLIAVAGLSGGGGGRGPAQHVETEVMVDGGRDKIAILPIEGAIDGSMTRQVFQYCEYIKSDANIKAVVIAVDSPGGGVTSSDEIHHLITQLKGTRRKVVVSMGTLAASGGYYVSMPADRIYAQPTTITGSIGVIMQTIEVTEMMKKIGVQPETVKSDAAEEFKDAGSPFKKFSEADKLYFKGIINQAHAKFMQIVKDGRGTKLKDPVEKGAIGKVWTADDALALGLIDEIAYLDEVCVKTAADASLANPTVIRLKPKSGLFEALTASAPGGTTRVEVKVDPETLRKLTGSVLEYRYEGLR